MPVINNFLYFLVFRCVVMLIIVRVYNMMELGETCDVDNDENPMGTDERAFMLMSSTSYKERWKDKQEIYRQIASKFSIQISSRPRRCRQEREDWIS